MSLESTIQKNTEAVAALTAAILAQAVAPAAKSATKAAAKETPPPAAAKPAEQPKAAPAPVEQPKPDPAAKIPAAELTYQPVADLVNRCVKDPERGVAVAKAILEPFGLPRLLDIKDEAGNVKDQAKLVAVYDALYAAEAAYLAGKAA